MRILFRAFRAIALRLGLAMAAIFLCCAGLGEIPATKPGAGLSIAYSGSDKTVDVTAAPNVWLYVPAGKSPTPFLPGEKFTATFSGFLSVDLRGDYSFQAELNGHLKLEINGAVVLDANGTNSSAELSKLIRLGKGTNGFRAIFTSPARGDAFVRLLWKPKDGFAQPIPTASLTHFATTEEHYGKKLRFGRELLVEHRCLKCHIGPETGMPELAMDAPSFEGIGLRRNYEWMNQWLADPKSLQPTAHMPKIFHGKNAGQNVEDMADFLGSLTDVKTALKIPEHGKAGAGQKLFGALHCAACHNDPERSEADAKRISLKQVAVKFTPGMLTEFLKKPNAHYDWIRMPEFKLNDEQRESLAAYLISKSDKSTLRREPASSENILRGKQLVQTSGCLNCHSLKLENQFSTKTLAQIANWKAGCLAEKLMENSKAPQFNFPAEQREALQAFVATDRRSLSRHVPSEFAARQSRNLNCLECHEKIENIPRFEILGEKLKPEWSAKFIAGEISYKPRPWLEAQMPAFPKHAQLLAEGLAAQHGLLPQTPTEPPIDNKAAEIGRNLVSVPPFGFSCVTCHAVGKFGTTQVFEAPGINLAYSGERLLPTFFKHWLRNPQSIDPASKMPTYFYEEGKSPLTEVYEGDGGKQINAMWQYLRLGEKMPAPRTE